MEKNAFTRWGWKACLECGDSIAPEAPHECERERYINFQVCLFMTKTVRAEEHLAAYLATPQGAFAAYYAERERALLFPAKR